VNPIAPDRPATVAAAISTRADDANVGLRFEDEDWSWSRIVTEMASRAAQHRQWVTRGLDPPHVGVLLDNQPEFLFQLGGAALAGTVLALLNPTRRGEELARDIRHSDCGIVVTDREHGQLLDGLDLGGAEILFIETIRDQPHPSNPIESVDEQPGPEDLLLLLFTSGSTGAPKAVRVTQGRLAQTSASMGLGSGDVIYCAMPLFHGNALISCVLPAIGTGARLVLRRKFSASCFAADIRDNGATFTSTVGRALAHVVSTPESADESDNRLKFVLAPESSPRDIAEFERRFGCLVVSGYGSSENAVILVPGRGLPPDALGVAPPGADIVVADPETGAECPRVQFDTSGRMLNAEEAIGELVGRNSLDRFEGYYNNDEATKERTRNGWYWTGDLAYRDENGVFFFAGRTLDWLRVDSENFAAGPVERVLARLPDVTGVAVLGVPDDRTADDQVLAVLEIPGESRFDPGAFEEFLAAQPDLGTKWIPRFVRPVSALPVGATNKIDKAMLRSEGWAPDPTYWRPSRSDASFRLMTDSDRKGFTDSSDAHRSRRA
jgi:fatty-acyl-CoA synthase